MIGASCHIISSAWLGSDKYTFLSHWFDSNTVQTSNVQIPRSPRMEYGPFISQKGIRTLYTFGHNYINIIVYVWDFLTQLLSFSAGWQQLSQDVYIYINSFYQDRDLQKKFKYQIVLQNKCILLPCITPFNLTYGWTVQAQRKQRFYVYVAGKQVNYLTLTILVFYRRIFHLGKMVNDQHKLLMKSPKVIQKNCHLNVYALYVINN